MNTHIFLIKEAAYNFMKKHYVKDFRKNYEKFAEMVDAFKRELDTNQFRGEYELLINKKDNGRIFIFRDKDARWYMGFHCEFFRSLIPYLEEEEYGFLTLGENVGEIYKKGNYFDPLKKMKIEITFAPYVAPVVERENIVTHISEKVCV